MMKNPLCRYDKYLDAIEFLKDNFVCYSDKIVVPYAEKCYFPAPLFYKFNFCLNFVDDNAFYFWKAFKEEKALLMQTINVFKKYLVVDNDSDDFLQNMLMQETKPIFKALLFLYCSNSHHEKAFNSSLSLSLDKVALTRDLAFNKSDFILHSCVDNFSLKDNKKLSRLNEYKSKIIIANNSSVVNFIEYDHKIDFEECYLLVTSR
jgi:hypothetical protein